MPLHHTALVSRRELDHPDEKPPVKVSPLAYERVLKFNPYHGPDGRFASGSGKGKSKPPSAEPQYSVQQALDGGFSRGGPAPHDPHFNRGDSFTPTPGFHVSSDRSGTYDALGRRIEPAYHMSKLPPAPGTYTPTTLNAPKRLR